MNLYDYLFGTRASVTTQNVWSNLYSSYSGRVIDDDSALKVSTVYDCIRVLGETLGTMPLVLYRRTDGGKERAKEHPLYPILHRKPNNYQPPVLWKEMMMGHLCLRGAAFSQIVRDKGERVIQIIPLHPDRIKLDWASNNRIFAEYTIDDSGNTRIIKPEQLLYVPGFATDPLKPYSPIDLMATSIDAALSMTESSAQFFSKSTRPSGVLKYPTRIKEDKARKLRAEFERANSGVENAFSTILLEEGLEWQQIGLTNEQSQFIQGQEFSVEDICRYFRVPPHLVGHLKRATYSNIEHQSLEFVKYTMAPWIKRFEEIINITLLSEPEQDDFFVEFLVDGLLRGDVKTRNEAYAIGVQNGWLSRNEVREMENRNHVEGLDEMLTPLNMAEGNQDEVEKDEGVDDGNQSETKTYLPILKDAVGRILRKENKMAERAKKQKVEMISLGNHDEWVTEILKPIFRTLDIEDKLQEFVTEFVSRSTHTRLNGKEPVWEDEIEKEVEYLIGAQNGKGKTLDRVH